jgi:peptide/nickel transport system ATP-binding protein
VALSLPLEVHDLCKYFYDSGQKLADVVLRRKHVIRALDGVSLELRSKEILGLVGETGCGKSTLGRTIVRLYEPTSGRIIVDGADITGLSDNELKPFRRRMQIVFQNPYSSLNPRRMVEEIIREPFQVHSLGEPDVPDVLKNVELEGHLARRYPHELSGGQRQRVAIARALAVNPSFIVCDEITSSLDVSTQAQIIDLLKSLQKETGISFLFISHDLGVVRSLSHRVAVMYAGKIVEKAAVDEIFRHPRHPYTQLLMESVPDPDPEVEWRPPKVKEEPPSPRNFPPGCRFHPRCPYAMSLCVHREPSLNEELAHAAACHLTAMN